MTLKKALILILSALIVWIIFVFFSIKGDAKRDKYEKFFFQNNTIIKGKIDSIYDSGNHCFSIIYLKNFYSNKNFFNPFQKNIFPYAVKNGECEVYSWSCLHNVAKGDSVIVDSNKRTIRIVAKDSLGSQLNYLRFVDSEKKRIIKNSKIKF